MAILLCRSLGHIRRVEATRSQLTMSARADGFTVSPLTGNFRFQTIPDMV
jgi:hypothetical protein